MINHWCQKFPLNPQEECASDTLSKEDGMSQADIGMVGLAVMGRNLALNMNDKGFSVAATSWAAEEVDGFMRGEASGRSTIYGFVETKDFVESLSRPRKIMLMVTAGEITDYWIDTLLPFLEEGDVLIDGGNAHFPDTVRRHQDLKEKGILFLGTGVSGGEEGARTGPSLMPGGEKSAWPLIKPIFQSIAAKTDSGEACCDWVGEGGAGHYVKMVHNGIEYGDMQLITEAYQLMKVGLGMSAGEMHDVFARWNKGELDSYLIEITRDIMARNDEDGTPLVEKILDTAGQKGTGKWTGVSALELGIPRHPHWGSRVCPVLERLKRRACGGVSGSLWTKCHPSMATKRPLWMTSNRPFWPAKL